MRDIVFDIRADSRRHGRRVADSRLCRWTVKKGGATMNITDVRVRRVSKEGKMKAVVSITIDNEFAVHDIKVIEGEKGLFIAMPSRKAADGEYRDIAHPINSQTRNELQNLILTKYEETVAEEEAEGREE